MQRLEFLNKTYLESARKTELFWFALVTLAFIMAGIVCPLVARYTGATQATNQFIIGSIVNTSLIITAVNIKGMLKILPLVILPSIFAMILGFAFNNPTQGMLMIPFIWVGNLALVLSFKIIFVHLKSKNPKLHIVNYLIATIVGVGLKATIIFTGLQIIIATGIPPAPWSAMVWNTFGVYQLATASIGAMVAFGIICGQVAFKKYHLNLEKF